MRYFIISAILYGWMCIFTYGHALIQMRHEDAQECADNERRDPGRLCVEFPRMEAWFMALFWPYHWSEYLWYREEHQP